MNINTVGIFKRQAGFSPSEKAIADSYDGELDNPRNRRRLNAAMSFQTGFTLTELVIVIFLGIILLLGLLSLYSWHEKVYSFQQAVVLSTEQSRSIGETVQFYALQSRRVLASSSIESVDYISTSTSVVLELPAVDVSGNQLAGLWDKAVFYLSGQKFFSKIAPAASSSRQAQNKLLSDGVDFVEITYDNGNFDRVKEISVKVSVVHPARGGARALGRFEQNMRLRNYHE